MINFVSTIGVNCYYNVLQQYIKNIVRDETEYQITDRSYDNMVNVHFFLEKKVLETVKMKGISVFVCHGIADKRYRIIDQLRKFDYIVVSGPAWKDMLMSRGIPENKLVIGGYVKIDHLYNGPRLKKHVLWAPSHNVYVAKAALSSYPDLLQVLKGHVGVVHSTHPANNPSHKYTDVELAKASAVIADAGSTIYEAWALDIPVIFPDWIVKKGILHHFHSTFEAEIYTKGIGYHVSKANGFSAALKDAVNEGITKQEQDFIEKIFPRNLRGKSGELTWNILKEIEKRRLLCLKD